MKIKLNTAKVYMKNNSVIKVKYEDDEWQDIYDNFLYNKPLLVFNNATIKTENINAIVW
jgi:hypothetical protein